MEKRIIKSEQSKACQELIKKEYEDLSLINVKTADIVLDFGFRWY